MEMRMIGPFGSTAPRLRQPNVRRESAAIAARKTRRRMSSDLKTEAIRNHSLSGQVHPAVTRTTLLAAVLLLGTAATPSLPPIPELPSSGFPSASVAEPF